MREHLFLVTPPGALGRGQKVQNLWQLAKAIDRALHFVSVPQQFSIISIAHAHLHVCTKKKAII